MTDDVDDILDNEFDYSYNSEEACALYCYLY